MQKQQKLCKQIEEKIAQQEKEKQQLELLLTTPDIYSNKEKFIETEKNYTQAVQNLSILNKQYDTALEALILLEAI